MYLVASVRLCVCNQRAYADNCADAVDQLFIFLLASHGVLEVTEP